MRLRGKRLPAAAVPAGLSPSETADRFSFLFLFCFFTYHCGPSAPAPQGRVPASARLCRASRYHTLATRAGPPSRAMFALPGKPWGSLPLEPSTFR